MSKLARSPRHPVFGLGEAIQKIRDFYRINGRAHVSPDVAVQAWKYTGLNGASLRTLATIRQYGLLDEVGKDVRVSPLALTLMVEPEESPDYAAAIHAAAREPRIFVEILEEFPHDLPAEQGVISYLIRKKNFAEDAARKVNAVLRDTLALVERYQAPPIQETGDVPPRDRQPPPPQTGAGGRLPSAGQGGTLGQDGQNVGGGLDRKEPEGMVMRYEYALPDGQATLVLAGDNLTAEDVADVYHWLNGIKRTLERRVGTAASIKPPAALRQDSTAE
jgi:hypothetical protein